MHHAVAAPITAETSPNPTNSRIYWHMNCTNGQLWNCEALGARCNNAWVETNDFWCSQHCDCHYLSPCDDFCRQQQLGGNDITDGEAKISRNTVTEAADSTSASA